ncbi:MAG TPA: helix-turn-helix transcriptional regulator [Rhodocyclaceae bacterium]|nr:helix-turn-helix transcriptional regulator [Rhodocyclaceae bacterium]
MDEAVAFGKVLRRLRKEAGLTQEQLGLEADLRRTYVSILELGQQQPSLNTLIKLARALKIPAAEIVAAVESELSRAEASNRQARA